MMHARTPKVYLTEGLTKGLTGPYLTTHISHLTTWSFYRLVFSFNNASQKGQSTVGENSDDWWGFC